MQATSPRRKRRTQQWFNQECYILRKEVIQAQYYLRTNVQNTTPDAGKDRLYKILLKEKERTYWEGEGKGLAEDAKKDPHIAIRPRRQAQTHYINMEECQTHLSNILKNEGLITRAHKKTARKYPQRGLHCQQMRSKMLSQE